MLPCDKLRELMDLVLKAFTVYLAYSIKSYWTQFENGFNSFILKSQYFQNAGNYTSCN